MTSSSPIVAIDPAPFDSIDYALVGDIGGTNARFALAPLVGAPRLIAMRRWRVADFPTLAGAVAAYLDEAAPNIRTRVGAIAVAGPAVGDEVQVTNCHWRFSIADTQRELGFDRFHVINDFAANSWALPELEDAELIPIGASGRSKAHEGTYAVLGPGTGLGVGAVHRNGDGRMTVLESEGGHVAFAPSSDEEDMILRRLRRRHGRVSYERLLCGAGLVNIYDALADCGTAIEPSEVTARTASDPLAMRAVELFCEILGGFAGDVAMMVGAWNGIYLAGGVLGSMRQTLAGGGFRRCFENKGRFSSLLAKVPTMLVDQPALGLLGAAAALRQLPGAR